KARGARAGEVGVGCVGQHTDAEAAVAPVRPLDQVGGGAVVVDLSLSVEALAVGGRPAVGDAVRGAGQGAIGERAMEYLVAVAGSFHRVGRHEHLTSLATAEPRTVAVVALRRSRRRRLAAIRRRVDSVIREVDARVVDVVAEIFGQRWVTEPGVSRITGRLRPRVAAVRRIPDVDLVVVAAEEPRLRLDVAAAA